MNLQTTMKKTFLTAIVLLGAFTISCSDDDDSNTDSGTETGTEQDAIIGTWTFTQNLVDGKEGDALDDCDKKTNYVFKSDNSSEDNFYESTTSGSDCETEKATGTWKKNSDTSYTGTYTDDIETYNVSFKLSEGKLIVEDEEQGKITAMVFTKS